MSEDLWVADPETEHRRRAIWGLGVLGLLAAIVVALMVFLLGSGGGSDNGLKKTDQIPITSSTPTAGTSPTQHSSSNGSGQSSPPSRSSASTSATTSCASGSSCTLEGDAGRVIQAINSFRTSNGVPSVPGATSDAAKKCSLSNGSSSCPQNYFWEPITPQDGKAVVTKIASRSSGRSFLLDPTIKSVQVGWAYVGGQYSCTIIGVF